MAESTDSGLGFQGWCRKDGEKLGGLHFNCEVQENLSRAAIQEATTTPASQFAQRYWLDTREHWNNEEVPQVSTTVAAERLPPYHFHFENPTWIDLIGGT